MKKNLKQFDLLSKNNFCIIRHWAFSSVLFISFLTILISSCAVEEENSYTDPIDKFLGAWSVSDQSGRINYSVTIVRNPSSSTNVLLNNFADMGETANGLVVGNTIVIDKQDIGSDFLCEGSGSYKSDNQLNFEFVLDDGIELESRKAVFTK